MKKPNRDIERIREAKRAIEQKFPTTAKAASASFVILKWILFIGVGISLILIIIIGISGIATKNNDKILTPKIDSHKQVKEATKAFKLKLNESPQKIGELSA